MISFLGIWADGQIDTVLESLSVNIEVGLNMHEYDDIGDASSLRGLISSFLKSQQVATFAVCWLLLACQQN